MFGKLRLRSNLVNFPKITRIPRPENHFNPCNFSKSYLMCHQPPELKKALCNLIHQWKFQVILFYHRVMFFLVWRIAPRAGVCEIMKLHLINLLQFHLCCDTTLGLVPLVANVSTRLSCFTPDWCAHNHRLSYFIL